MSRSTAIQSVTSGRQTVTTAGTAVQLVTTTGATIAQVVVVTAETDNTGVITLGGSDVVAALATRKGTPLAAGQSISLDIGDAQIDLSKLYIDTTVNTDGVTFTVFK